jgi:hypothetical protein
VLSYGRRISGTLIAVSHITAEVRKLRGSYVVPQQHTEASTIHILEQSNFLHLEPVEILGILLYSLSQATTHTEKCLLNPWSTPVIRETGDLRGNPA